MYGNAEGFMMSGGGFMWIFWVLLIIIVIVMIKVILKNGLPDRNEKNETPLEILEIRFARGEIDEEEFEQRRKKLIEQKMN